MKQIPDFLKEYETALQKYRRRSIEILATALNDGETTDIKSSTFLGAPYLRSESIYYPLFSDKIPCIKR